ncbi:MAG: phosphodiester glycosidase family protein [Bacteroidales bacterium]|nr:phosphodiester glycosidase family protein [Bacteroidales bacterium]
MTILLGVSVCMAQPKAPVLLDKEGWVSDTLRVGLVWHNFTGTDNISCAPQVINVLEFDLDQPDLKLSYEYYPDKEVLSEVARDTKAIAATNASFGPPHTFIRVDGDTWCDIEIEPGNRDWWKHEAAVLFDGENNVSFLNYDGRPDEAVEAYRSRTEPNILSGTPILIDNYQLPEWFLQAVKGYKAKTSTIEQRHPRTAIALTGDRHLLLITVDGRWLGKASGMTCDELRRFLVRYFNPQYAMNMDGGGSSSMFVRDRGDEQTGIVSYPCEKTGETGEGFEFDHSHERRLPTFFVIKEVKNRRCRRR